VQTQHGLKNFARTNLGSTGIDVGFINQIIVQCLDSQGITDKNKKKL